MSGHITKIKMNSRTHDEARVVSAQFELRMLVEGGITELLNSLTDEMKDYNSWAADNAVIIGHIKGYLTWGEEAIMISTTGEEVQVKGSQISPEPPCDIDVGIASIVFGIELEKAQKRIEELVSNIFDDFGLEYSITYESDSHDHEHDHGDSCNCGMDHEHNHKHGETCNCGHEHENHEHAEACGCCDDCGCSEQEHGESCSCGNQDHHHHDK